MLRTATLAAIILATTVAPSLAQTVTCRVSAKFACASAGCGQGETTAWSP